MTSTRWDNDKTSSALHFIFKVPKCYGTFPFKDDLKVSVPLLIGTVLLRVTLISIRLTFIYLRLSSDETPQDEIVIDVKPCIMIGEYIGRHSVSLFTVLWLFYKSKDMRKIRKGIAYLENVFRQFKVTWEWTPTLVTLNIDVFFVAAMECIFVYKAIEVNDIEWVFEAFDFLLTYPMVFAIQNQFAGLASLLISQANSLRWLQKNDDVLKYNSVLVTQFRLLNGCYGFVLLIISVYIFFYLLYVFWLLVVGLSTYKPSLTWDTQVTYLWVIIALYGLARITSTCSYINAQINKINRMLYGRTLADPNNEALDFHLVAKREVVFSACGFFTLDNSLICSMIATATTYLVILLQIPSKGPSQVMDVENTTHV